MEYIFTQLPSNAIGWLTLLGFVAVGAVAIWGIIDKTVRDRRKDALEAADSLIHTLNERIDGLETRINDLEEERDAQATQITELKATNELLTKILQGRDESTLAFQREVLAAVKIGVETNGIVKKTEEHLGTLAKSISELADAVKNK